VQSWNATTSAKPSRCRACGGLQDRIAGASKQAKGAVKVATGKALGDGKLVADGKSDKVEGKIQNALGDLKDALKK
jgi:uncharacterized protein YjbJ (UPF0337 family)